MVHLILISFSFALKVRVGVSHLSSIWGGDRIGLTNKIQFLFSLRWDKALLASPHISSIILDKWLFLKYNFPNFPQQRWCEEHNFSLITPPITLNLKFMSMLDRGMPSVFHGFLAQKQFSGLCRVWVEYIMSMEAPSSLSCQRGPSNKYRPRGLDDCNLYKWSGEMIGEW